MECILLEEAQTDDSGNFQRQFLVIRKNITTNQFYDLHQVAFLVQDRHQLISFVYEILVGIVTVPWCQVIYIFTVACEPVDSREMSCICQGFIQSPEAAYETFGILCVTGSEKSPP